MYSSTAGLSINASNGSVNLGTSTPGTYTVTYTIAANAGCAQYQRNTSITIVPPPSAGTANPIYICRGTSFTLDVLVINEDLNGSWTDSNGDLVSGTVAPTATTNYTYTVPGTGPCPPSVRTVQVTVIQHADAGVNGTLSICSAGAPVDLFSSLLGTPSTGGSWSGPSPVVGGMYAPATMTPGAYTYTVSGQMPCPAATSTVTVTENNSCMDCANVPYGTASIDACGVCSGGNTGLLPNSTCLDCNGVVNGPDTIGASCDDGLATTVSDVYQPNCVCAGQPVRTMPERHGTASIDACGVCSGGNTGLLPNSTCLDCNGVVNGPDTIGASCDDGLATTVSDVYQPNCVCAGQPVDCFGTINGTASIDACGVCSGGNTGLLPNSTCLDCNGVVNGPDTIGATCDDGLATTVSDVYQPNCVCAGQPVDCFGTINGTASIDACGVCSGGNTGLFPNSTCLDCNGVVNGPDTIGATCDDGLATTVSDVYQPNCVCAGQPVDCFGTINGAASIDACGVCSGGNTGLLPNSTCLDCNGVVNGPDTIGATCDDGLVTTVSDVYQPNCVCAGQPVDCFGTINGTASIDACSVCSVAHRPAPQQHMPGLQRRGQRSRHHRCHLR